MILEIIIFWSLSIVLIIFICAMLHRKKPPKPIVYLPFDYVSATIHLIDHGFAIKNGMIKNIKSKNLITFRDMSAINYLFTEWDFAYDEVEVHYGPEPKREA